MLTATSNALHKTATIMIARTNPGICWNIASRTLTTINNNRLKALCTASSGVISDKIHVMDKLVDRLHAGGAIAVFQKECPVVGSTVGRQFRHYYDVRERGTVCERDIFAFGDRDDVEIALLSTLEREMGFSCHHAIHHNNLVRIMAAAGKIGLTMDDLPAGFGRSPSMLVYELKDAA